jgi:hypothetical protein
MLQTEKEWFIMEPMFHGSSFMLLEVSTKEMGFITPPPHQEPDKAAWQTHHL